MATGLISKREFIQAYQWLYGVSKKEAEYIFSISTYEYKLEIIRCFLIHCKKEFHFD